MTTRSSPPSELDPQPTALATFAADVFERAAASEGLIFFCVDNAPRRACTTRAGADGSLTFRTSLTGRVISVEPDALVLEVGERTTRIRHHLPAGLTLEALTGQVVRFELSQIYRGRGRATIDAELSDTSGRMILWARDGRFPSDRDAHGLSLRLTVDANETRLAVRTRGGVTSLGSPGARDLVVDGKKLALALVRIGPDDASFALLRR